MKGLGGISFLSAPEHISSPDQDSLVAAFRSAVHLGDCTSQFVLLGHGQNFGQRAVVPIKSERHGEELGLDFGSTVGW